MKTEEAVKVEQVGVEPTSEVKPAEQVAEKKEEGKHDCKDHPHEPQEVVDPVAAEKASTRMSYCRVR